MVYLSTIANSTGFISYYNQRHKGVHKKMCACQLHHMCVWSFYYSCVNNMF